MEKPDDVGRSLSLEDLVRQHIRRVLDAHHGNISAAARALGMHRRTLQRKLHRHDPCTTTSKETP